MNDTIDPALRRSVLSIIHDNWDFFCEQGVSRPISDFGFFLDTGDSQPVYYRQLVYGIQEQKIITKHIHILNDNG